MLNFFEKRKLFPSLFECVMSIPKTIFFNFRVLPFRKAIKLPFFVSCYTKLKGVNKKSFICDFEDVHMFMSRIGIAGSGNGYIVSKRSAIFIKNQGKIIVKGPVGLSRNLYLEAKGGTIIFGSGVKMNVNCHIASEKALVEIGDETVFGWNCTIKNCDGHFVVEENQKKSNCSDVFIGKHCWICSNATILKGGYLGSNCILSYGSLLTKKVSHDSNLLYGGVPAHIIKKNVNWDV